MLPIDKRIQTKKDLKNWLKYEKNKYGIKSDLFNKIVYLFFGYSYENFILFKHQKLLRKTEYIAIQTKKLDTLFQF